MPARRGRLPDATDYVPDHCHPLARALAVLLRTRPAQYAPDIAGSAKAVSYGWGMIPVDVSIAGVVFTTALFPKDEGYLLPIKAAVRNRIGVTVGDDVEVEMTVGPS